MNFSSFCASVCAVSALMLAACGGSDAPTARDAYWANPAVFVPGGQDKVSLPLTGCLKATGEGSQPLSNASIEINAAGDMSFLATPAGSTASASLQASLPYAQASGSMWLVSGSAQSPTFFLSMGKLSDTRVIQAFSLSAGGNFTNQVLVWNEATELEVSCDPISSLVLAQRLSHERLAKYFGTGAGVSTLNDLGDSSLQANLMNNEVTWVDNPMEEDPSLLRFNFSSGQVAFSEASSTPSFTVVPLGLSSGQEGMYYELTCKNAFPLTEESASQEIRFVASGSTVGTGEDARDITALALASGNQFVPLTTGVNSLEIVFGLFNCAGLFPFGQP